MFSILPRPRSNVKFESWGSSGLKLEAEVRGYTIYYWPSVRICITQEWQLERRSFVNTILGIFIQVSLLNTAKTLTGSDRFPNTPAPA
jgi:hypothetical protein